MIKIHLHLKIILKKTAIMKECQFALQVRQQTENSRESLLNGHSCCWWIRRANTKTNKSYLEMQLVVSFTKLCQEGKKALKQRGETTDEAKTCILGSRPD